MTTELKLEERRERKKIANKKWNDKNKEKRNQDQREYRANNLVKEIERDRQYHIETRKRNALYVIEAKKNPCVDCGNTFHPVAMDFDHVRGEKINEVAYLVSHARSIRVIQEEIDKCELVCANCHRVRTWGSNIIYEGVIL